MKNNVFDFTVALKESMNDDNELSTLAKVKRLVREGRGGGLLEFRAVYCCFGAVLAKIIFTYEVVSLLSFVTNLLKKV